MSTPPAPRISSHPIDLSVLASVTSTVRRAATKVLGHRHPDLDDTVQEALLAFIAAWGAFRAECHPGGYAGRIATREAIRTLRRDQRRQRKLRRLAVSMPVEPAIAPHDLHDPRRARVVAKLLDLLPSAQREALVQRVAYELSLNEVARIAGAPPNTIRSRVRMARETLRSHLAARPSLAAALSY